MDSGIYVQDVKWILVPMYDLIFLMDLTTASLYFDHHHHEALSSWITKIQHLKSYFLYRFYIKSHKYMKFTSTM